MLERVSRRLRLDTIGGKMATAASLDKLARFVDIPLYCPNPVPGTACMELVL